EAAVREERIEAAKARAREAMDQRLEAQSAEREAAARRQEELLDRVEVTGSRLRTPPAAAAPPPEPPVVFDEPSPVDIESPPPAPVVQAEPEAFTRAPDAASSA